MSEKHSCNAENIWTRKIRFPSRQLSQYIIQKVDHLQTTAFYKLNNHHYLALESNPAMVAECLRGYSQIQVGSHLNVPSLRQNCLYGTVAIINNNSLQCCRISVGTFAVDCNSQYAITELLFCCQDD